MSDKEQIPKGKSPPFSPPKDTAELAADKAKQQQSDSGQTEQARQGSIRGKRHRE